MENPLQDESAKEVEALFEQLAKQAPVAPTSTSIHVENATNVINGPVTITNQTTHNGH